MNMLIDLTHTITHNMQVYPGDRSPSLTKDKDFSIDGYTDYLLISGMHTGTHIDGPQHLTADGRHISGLPLTSFIGKGCVINAEGIQVIKWEDSYSPAVEGMDIVLVNTGFGIYFGTDRYLVDNPVIDESFAMALIGRKVKMLGIDLMSPDRHPHLIHKLLLSADILIAENLVNLEKLLNIRAFEIIALPLKIDSDSSPARIIAREIS
jgi:kynurenine formamidase